MTPRLYVLGALWGLGAGGLAALTFRLMTAVEHLVWSVSDARWYVAAAIMVGGGIIALLRRYTIDIDLDGQIADAADPVGVRRVKTGVLAASAIVAVGFGGAVGPEAGLLAVVAEAAAIVGIRIARTHAEQVVIGRAGSAAALAGLYGSPPGAAAYDDDALDPPKLVYIVSAVAGLLGFVITTGLVGREGRISLGLPAYEAPGDGTDLLLSVAPAVLGALFATGYLVLKPVVRRAVESVGSTPVVHTLVGTAAFAALAGVWPQVRFSGHHDFPELVAQIQSGSWLALAGFAVAKLLATALCLASGWRGGEIFPLMIAGGAAGALALVALPWLDTTPAVVAGLSAAATVGLRKPLAAFLICVFFVGPGAFGPLLVGAAVGMVLSRFAPEDVARH